MADDDHLYENVEEPSGPPLPNRSYSAQAVDQQINADSFVEEDELLYADIDLDLGDEPASDPATEPYSALQHSASEPAGVIYSDVVVPQAPKAPDLPGRSYPGANKELSSATQKPPSQPSYENAEPSSNGRYNGIANLKAGVAAASLSATKPPPTVATSVAKQDKPQGAKLRFAADYLDDKGGRLPVMLHIIHRATVGKILLVFDREKMEAIHTLPVKLMRGFGQKQEGSERRLKIEAGKRCPGGERTYRYVLDKSVPAKINITAVLRAKVNQNQSMRQQKKSGNARPVYKNV